MVVLVNYVPSTFILLACFLYASCGRGGIRASLVDLFCLLVITPFAWPLASWSGIGSLSAILKVLIAAGVCLSVQGLLLWRLRSRNLLYWMAVGAIATWAVGNSLAVCFGLLFTAS